MSSLIVGATWQTLSELLTPRAMVSGVFHVFFLRIHKCATPDISEEWDAGECQNLFNSIGKAIFCPMCRCFSASMLETHPLAPPQKDTKTLRRVPWGFRTPASMMPILRLGRGELSFRSVGRSGRPRGHVKWNPCYSTVALPLSRFKSCGKSSLRRMKHIPTSE